MKTFAHALMIALTLVAFALPLTGQAASAVPKGYECSGTEPFWSLDVKGQTAKFKNPDPAVKPLDISLAAPIEGSGASDGIVLYKSTTGQDSITVLPASLVSAKCSDGMSTNDFDFHTTINIGTTVYYGCCNQVK